MTFDGRTVPQWIELDHEGTAGTLRYKVVAGIMFVECSVSIAMTSGAAVTLLATGNAIPTDLCPTFALNMAIARVNAGDQGGIVTRNTDGTIVVAQHTGSPATSVQFAYDYALG